MNRRETGCLAGFLILVSLACLCASPLGSTSLVMGLVIAALVIGFFMAVVE